jgi:hypothetical protein
MIQIVCGIAVWLEVASVQAAVDFSRYAVILERRPFGDKPVESRTPPKTGPQIPKGPSFADSLQVCAITEVGGVIKVGFFDKKTKPPKSYFLFVGESEDGIEVVDADYAAETVTLRKGTEERQLRMGGGASASNASHTSALASRHSSSYIRRRARIKRTRAEIEEDRRKAIERKKPILEGEEYEAHIRQYNLDQIRTGGIPLPIPLTPEEDAQLVEEGVLDPVE